MNEKVTSIEDRKRMSFRQAEGTEAAPAALKWGELDEDLRLEIWNVVHMFLELKRPSDSNFFSDNFTRNLAQALRRPLKVPIDEALVLFERFTGAVDFLKNVILGSNYDDVIEIIQSLARRFSADSVLQGLLSEAFGDTRSPYQLIGPPPTIVPKGIEIEGRSVGSDLSEIAASSAKGAFAHLISAAEALNRNEPRDAIRESIHAVESAAKQITGLDKATLPDALRVLQRQRGLHPDLRESFARACTRTPAMKRGFATRSWSATIRMWESTKHYLCLAPALRSFRS
jgi:hypothetical protein